MKIAIAKYDDSAIGGGWSFISNFKKAMGEDITSYEDADIYFIPSASMVSRDEVQQAMNDGKKVVLRCDNIIRNSRNRNTGMTRMKDFSEWADLTIFQSSFAEELLNPYLQTDSFKIILNSADENIFYNNREASDRVYLYSRYSSDETKNWEMARVAYQKIHEADPTAELRIIGRPDMTEHNFDFYNGEKYQYYGLISDKNSLAEIYRQCDRLLYTYFNDACSNTVIESMLCGMEVMDCYGMGKTGGTVEIINKFITEGSEYFHLKRMGDEYREAFSEFL